MYSASFGGLDGSVPLGQDGISGSFPFSWASQAELVWCAWAKEDGQSQAWIRQEQREQVGFGINISQKLVYVWDII